MDACESHLSSALRSLVALVLRGKLAAVDKRPWVSSVKTFMLQYRVLALICDHASDAFAFDEVLNAR
jgi:hypothetical protein